MKRYGANTNSSRKQFKKRVNKTARLNLASPRRGGIRL